MKIEFLRGLSASMIHDITNVLKTQSARSHSLSLSSSLSNTAAWSVAFSVEPWRTTDPSSISFAREEPRGQVAHWDGATYMCRRNMCYRQKAVSPSAASLFYITCFSFTALLADFRTNTAAIFSFLFPRDILPSRAPRCLFSLLPVFVCEQPFSRPLVVNWL